MKHNWTYKKLGEVATLTGGFTPKADELFSEGKYPYFKVSDMNTAGNEVVLTKTPSFVVDSKKCYPKGAIVFPKNGAAVSTNKKRILGQDSIVDLNTCAAILNSDIDIKFAYYWFYNLDFKTLVRGGALPTLDLKGLRSLQFPIPSLDEQQAIVRELDGINHLIDLQEEQLREYDRLAQSLFYTTFGDPTTNPKGWEVKKLGEVCRFLNGDRGVNYPSAKDFVAEGIPFINAGHLQNGKICFEDMNYISKERFDLLHAGKVQKDDILFCLRGSLGKFAIVDFDDFGAIASSLVIIRSLDVAPLFIVRYLQTSAVKEQIERANNGSSQPNLSAKSVADFKLPLPPLALQQSFAAQIEASEQQKALVRKSLEETRTLLAARMQYYFE